MGKKVCKNREPINQQFRININNSKFTEEQVLSIVNQVKEGNKEALDVLCEKLNRHVVCTARVYENRGCSINLLIEAGYKGIERAAQLYDMEFGICFTSYALWFTRLTILSRISISDWDKNPYDFSIEEKKAIIANSSNNTVASHLIKWFGLEEAPQSIKTIWHL